MIILPDRNTPRARILMPVPTREWRAPSQAVSRDAFGNPIIRTKFRIRAKTHDGVALWTGWFEDRDDADAFLEAVALGTLQYEPALWELPTPMWPGLDPGLLYDFATVTILTSTSQLNYTFQSDWNSNDNTIEGVGAGRAGTAGFIYGSGGGGGGAYAKTLNWSATPGSTAAYRCGIPTGTTGAGSTKTANTYLGSAMVAGGAYAPYGGQHAGVGGLTADSTGNTLYAGGYGGAGWTNGAAGIGGGGGGAAGPNGAGGTGGYLGNGNNNGGAGNAGGSGGGAGGTGSNTPTAGGAGTYWEGSTGPGGGGGGAQWAFVAGAAGGNYGAGGGGGAYGGGYASGAGAGKQGILVVTNYPVVRRAAFSCMPF